MAKNNAANFNPLLEPELPEQNLPQLFRSVPNGPVTNYGLIAISSSDSPGELPERYGHGFHNVTVEVNKVKGEGRLISFKGRKGDTLTIKFKDINSISANNKTIKKLFLFLLSKVAEQITVSKDGSLSDYKIGFSMQELVDVGMYKSIRSAYKGMQRAAWDLVGISIGGEIKKGRKSEQTTVGSLFTFANVKMNYVEFELSGHLNWNVVAPYYTIIPNEIFGLTSRGFDLCSYIFYLARQNTEKIKKTGGLTISIKAICDHLRLPSYIGNKDPQRTIKEPIEAAIEDIEDKFRTTCFTIEYDENFYDAPIAQFVNEGFLRIQFKEEYAKHFLELQTTKEKQIQQAQKRKAKIEDQVKLRQKLKEQEQKETEGQGSSSDGE